MGGACPPRDRRRRRRLGPRDQTHGEDITERERQVGRLVAEDLTNRQIGAILFITPKTVEYHLRSLYSKLAVGSRTDLARRFAPARIDAAI